MISLPMTFVLMGDLVYDRFVYLTSAMCVLMDEILSKIGNMEAAVYHIRTQPYPNHRMSRIYYTDNFRMNNHILFKVFYKLSSREYRWIHNCKIVEISPIFADIYQPHYSCSFDGTFQYIDIPYVELMEKLRQEYDDAPDKIREKFDEIINTPVIAREFVCSIHSN